MENKQKIIYTVVVNKTKLNCINTKNGSIVGSLSIKGTISSGPIVTDDRCVVTIKSDNGSSKGYIYKLPNFSIITSFNY